jgi:RHS repeat-associated protein
VWYGGTWQEGAEKRYVYDGNNVIQERDGNNTVLVSYTRGTDLSGDFQDAGGIGGLLARTDVNGSAFYHADGNGNITMMIDSSGNQLAKYLYDSFGNTIGMWGTLAAVNTYRFSSKEIDTRSGLYYYDERYYDPNYQRWLNPDPIQEQSGFNLYEYVGNNPVNWIDPLGLAIYPNNFIGPLPPGSVYQWQQDAFTQEAEGNGISSDDAIFAAPALGWLAAGNAFQAANITAYLADQSLHSEDDQNGTKTCPTAVGAIKPATAGQLNNQIKKGQAPEGVDSAHPAQSSIPGSEPHIHYSDGTSSTQSGGVHDAGNGYPNPSNKIRSWLEENGWRTPPRPPIIE